MQKTKEKPSAAIGAALGFSLKACKAWNLPPAKTNVNDVNNDKSLRLQHCYGHLYITCQLSHFHSPVFASIYYYELTRCIIHGAVDLNEK